MIGLGSDKAPIVLCLSGGGLRAMLFHLGLLKALHSHKVDGIRSISKIKEIYSVSGGSIIAAHLIKNWDKYNGDEKQFAEMENELLGFARRNIRDRVIRRWIIFRIFGFRRAHWLRKEYESLFGPISIDDCYQNSGAQNPPKIHILTTSFKTGELCSFGHDNFEIIRRTSKGPVTIATACGHLKLAYAVAASSAFPPLFPPVPLTHSMLGNPETEDFLIPIHLSDGGVYDNLGLEKFLINFNSHTQNQGTLIVSNAGSSLRTEPQKTYSDIISRNTRASDILMRRVAENTESVVRRMDQIQYLAVNISSTVSDPKLSISTQQRLRSVRTDLDKFDSGIAQMLIDHGNRVGLSTLFSENWKSYVSSARPVSSESKEKFERIAKNASNRSPWSLIFDSKDWKALSVLWITAILLLSATFYIADNALKEQAAQDAKTKAEYNLAYVRDKIVPMQAAFANKEYDKLGQLLGAAIKTVEVSETNPTIDFKSNPVVISASDATKLASEQISYTINRDQNNYKQLVFINFAGTFTRAQIIGLNQALKKAGWKAQSESGERTSNAIDYNEIRYSGDNEAAAKSLASDIDSINITTNPIKTIRSSKIKPNELEIWISN